MSWKNHTVALDAESTERIGCVGGWAPGNYMAICLSCGKEHSECDKRASQCLPCAIIALKDRATLAERLRTSLGTLARVHTEAKDDVGFVVNMHSPLYGLFGYEASDYINAWKAVRDALGLPVEPGTKPQENVQDSPLPPSGSVG